MLKKTEAFILRLLSFVRICHCLDIVKFLVGKMHYGGCRGSGLGGFDYLLMYSRYLFTYLHRLPTRVLLKLFSHLFRLTTYKPTHPNSWPTYIPIHILSVHI
jgi:hypothetical protein